MKAVPILVLTNTVALALAVWLFVEQQDLKSQISGSTRATSGRRDVPGLDETLVDRVERLETRLRPGAERPFSVPEGSAAAAQPAEASPPERPVRGDPPIFPEAAAAEAGPEGFNPAEMEVFRKKVRKAQDLNRDEDEVRGVVDRLDRLVEERQIGPLSDVQKEKAAKSVLATRRKVPDIWRKVMSDPANQNMQWQERRQVVQNEMGNLRTAMQKEMEEYLPAPDAKKISEEAVRERGGMMFGGGPGGPGGVVEMPMPRSPGSGN